MRSKMDADRFYELSDFVREIVKGMSLEELKLFTAILSDKEANLLTQKIVAVEILDRIITTKEQRVSLEKAVEETIEKIWKHGARRMVDGERLW